MRMRHAAAVLVCCSTVLAACPALAQFMQQGPKLVGTGATGLSPQPNQGYSVALSADGNTAIVGGFTDNTVGCLFPSCVTGTGAAWVWTRSAGGWTQQGNKLVGSGAQGFSEQGISVSLSADGNTAIVGGHQDNNHAGAAWVWTRTGGVWTQQGNKLVGFDAVGAGDQGRSVSISADGNTAIVGGPGDNGDAGAAWIWTRSGGVWTQQGNKLVGSGAVGPFPANQGQSVSLSADGNTAIVGGHFDNGGAGAAWIWTRSGGVWSQQGSKLAGTGASSVSLSADGNTAIVGIGGGTGGAWVWTRTGGVWSQQGNKLVGSGAVGSAAQGTSVSLSGDGDTAVVGGSADDGVDGATWVWTRSGGVWTQQSTKLVGSGAAGSAGQGLSVALSGDGNTAIVGGPVDNNSIWRRVGLRQELGGRPFVDSSRLVVDHPRTRHHARVSRCLADASLIGGFLSHERAIRVAKPLTQPPAARNYRRLLSREVGLQTISAGGAPGPGSGGHG
jgi:hypothetical protein